jgi:hypothetical protein
MLVDVASRKFSFAFAPGRVASFAVPDEHRQGESYLHMLCKEAADWTSSSEAKARGMDVGSVATGYPKLFSPTLGTAKCAAYEIELLDAVPVRSPPYRCASPKAAIFKKMVGELLEQGVVRPSKLPYASPAFLVPKPGGDFRMVVDYRKVNAKVVFDSYPMPTIEQAFEQFGGGGSFFGVGFELRVLSNPPLS